MSVSSVGSGLGKLEKVQQEKHFVAGGMTSQSGHQIFKQEKLNGGKAHCRKVRGASEGKLNPCDLVFWLGTCQCFLCAASVLINPFYFSCAIQCSLLSNCGAALLPSHGWIILPNSKNVIPGHSY